MAKKNNKTFIAVIEVDDNCCRWNCDGYCEYIPDTLCMSYQFYSPNCCVWKCYIPR